MDIRKEYIIDGFSKLNKLERIRFIAGICESSHSAEELLGRFWIDDHALQQRIDEISENTVSNFHLPFSVAPNFIINDRMYLVPMVIEESSVVAAAAAAAKFWSERGGFRSEVISTTKLGQVHFIWKGEKSKLVAAMPKVKAELLARSHALTQNMRSRGGGIQDIELVDRCEEEADYYQLKVSFETCDSMGANFINSCLEEFAKGLRDFIQQQSTFTEQEREVRVIMSILSNYTPDCVVKTQVQCHIDQLASPNGFSAKEFSWRFAKAVRIAEIDEFRAATHNKGIFNGIDAVVLATGNDFRAVEAGGHAYACRNGRYQSLSHVDIEDDVFTFSLTIPLALGVVGGLTSLHPLARFSMELLGNPDAKTLMMVAASAGLANNYAAVKSLITTGIQKGHMRMHLFNILNHLVASEEQKKKAIDHFQDQVVSYSSVRKFLNEFKSG